MNKEHYYRLLENPKLLSEDSLLDLEKLISSYPYVENFRILYALNLLILDDFRYQKNLHKAAFHSSDRKKLKYWVDYMLKDEEENTVILEEKATPETNKIGEHEPISKESVTSLIETEIAEKEQIILKEEQDTEAISEDTIIDLIPKHVDETPSERTELEEEKEEPIETPIDLSEEKKKHQASKSKAKLLQLVRKRLAEIEVEKQGEQEEISTKSKDNEPEILKAQLIDRFIEVQPSISRPDKKDFHDPHKDAVGSTIDEDDFFVTETLAQIHRQQGNINKALGIYQKLILKNPEKSTYFAAQIEELSKNN